MKHLALIALGLSAGLVAGFYWYQRTSRLKADETVVLLPALARELTEGAWSVRVEGHIYEQERRPGARTMLRAKLGLPEGEMTAEEAAIFARRVRPFLIDTEERKTVEVAIGAQVFTLPRSDGNGAFAADFVVSATQLATATNVRVVTAAPDARQFTAPILQVTPRGWSVVSDLDDTIKVTNVRDKAAILRSTFLKPFVVVPGMAAGYTEFAQTQPSAAFHYVSSSPWQMQAELADFVRGAGFPAGSWHLRTWAAGEVMGHYDPEEHKLTRVRALLEAYPERHFILIGDSGERDPEIYGRLARENPARIQRVWIRDLGADPAEVLAARLATAFAAVPSAAWQVFTDPAEIRWPATEPLDGAAR
jgi:phosphatidate phosphatase APP1